MSTNDNSSTTNHWLTRATQQLQKAGIGTARLDALVLLEDVVGKNRTHLLAHPDLQLTHVQEAELDALLNRRVEHEPLAYIRGKTEFYGREFYINHDVLEPRPESETMIELLDTQGPIKTIIDVGTGSGALAISAALLLSNTTTYAIDINPKCLAVAQENAEKHEIDIQFLEGNLLEPLIGKPMRGPIAILANLPYVPDDYTLNQAAMNEPEQAIFGGPDGLDLYRNMFGQLHDHFEKPVFVYTESLPFQHKELQNIAVAQGFIQTAERDFIQVFERS